MLQFGLNNRMRFLELALPTILMLSLLANTQMQAQAQAQIQTQTQTQTQILTAADVIRLVRSQDPTAQEATVAVEVAQANLVEAGLYPNPTLTWERETLPDEGEDALVLTLPIDLSTTRSTRQHLKSIDVAYAKAHAAQTSTASVARALTLFYQLIGRKKRRGIEINALQRLTEAARIVTRRREEGNSSGYDESRLEIEVELATSTLRETEASIDRLRMVLKRLLGLMEYDIEWVGSLAADPSLYPEDTVQTNFKKPKSVRFLQAGALRAEAAYRSSAWTWIPEFVLSAGPRRNHLSSVNMGYTLEVALELPFFSRGQDLAARAAARRKQAQARVEKAERQTQIQWQQAKQRLMSARSETQRLATNTTPHIARLERAAQSGYREGELSILELLDARRARTLIERRQLELALAIKKAEVELCSARGDYE
jgi:outer membrane protein, heavy metal efflux system